MGLYSGYINRLVEELASLPGIGDKTAQRLAFHIIGLPRDRVERLAGTIISARDNVRYCRECLTLSDGELCPVCADAGRDHTTIMVVENVRDLAAYERTGRYQGVYHVLHGAISPMLGIGPSDIHIRELIERISGSIHTDEARETAAEASAQDDGREPAGEAEHKEVSEVILATGSSLEGETTAMYISKLLKPAGIKVTRIASGVPVGGDLEYIDEVTLLRALEGRTLL